MTSYLLNLGPFSESVSSESLLDPEVPELSDSMSDPESSGTSVFIPKPIGTSLSESEPSDTSSPDVSPDTETFPG